MSSKKVEDVHTTLLKKLISDSGLECLRSAPVSLESSEEEQEIEEQAPKQEEEIPREELTEEEEEEITEEEIIEEPPAVFPTPSLRRVMPERLRKIEESDRIHVLPNNFKTDIDPASIPKINSTSPQKYIDVIAGLVGCREYKSSYAEYWFLDTLANLLRRAQEDDMDRTSQAVLMLWFCEWMKEMQHFDAATRERMLRRWEDNMLSTANIIAENEFLPTPQEAEVFYTAKEVKETLLNIPKEGEKSKMFQISTIVDNRLHPALMDARDNVEYNNTGYECSLRDLSKIIHYIYDLFSTDYQYNLVRSIFTFSPENVTIDPPYQIQVPKRIYTVLKPSKAKPKSPKPKDKPKAKGKKNEPDTEEYILLMELKSRDMKQQEEQDERDREEWNRKSHILPLGFAATEEFFNLYWPPPPPDTPPVVVDVDPKAKKDAKKGKK